MIEARGLKKSFKAKKIWITAVNDISFAAHDGQITGLLGPNGAGKTTTMRMLYTLMRPEAGQVLVDGVDTVQEPARVRHTIGVLPDARGLYKRLTARENIAYFGQLHGMTVEQIALRVELLAYALDMTDILDRQVEGFSQGQRTKTAIARALVHDPKNVILDEPTNGLDVMTTRAMRRFMLSLKEENKCVIFSSHIMQEVAAVCDRIIIINQGMVVASGSADELMQQVRASTLEEAFVDIIGSEEGLHA